ncbi:MAG: FAD:protein FMN transferase [Alistipes sp.]
MVKGLLILCFSWIVCCLSGCDSRGEREYLTADGTMLGTTFHVVGDVQNCTSDQLYAAILEVDTLMKVSMSIFDEGSLLSRLNRNQTDSVDQHIAYNLALAEQVSILSGGCYDVTVKPLVEAWGFAGKERQQNPNIDSLLQFVGYDKVCVKNGRLVKRDPRVQLDFNSIAKGYTVDQVAALMERFGATNYLVDIGGEVYCQGVNAAGATWRIGVETPFDGNQTNGAYIQSRIQLSQGGLATSGNYRRFFMDEAGHKVAHTIDPRTGYSAVSRLLSATVVAENCALADAMGTMFMALGAEAALALVKQHPEMKVYFILAGKSDQEYETYTSPSMETLMMKNE